MRWVYGDGFRLGFRWEFGMGGGRALAFVGVEWEIQRARS